MYIKVNSLCPHHEGTQEKGYRGSLRSASRGGQLHALATLSWYQMHRKLDKPQIWIVHCEEKNPLPNLRSELKIIGTLPIHSLAELSQI